MNRRLWCIRVGQCAVSLAVSRYVLAQTDNVLHEGTPIRMRVNRSLSSATDKEGDTVDFTTLDDVKVGDVVVVPKGSTAMATVTEAVSKRSMGRAGKLSVNIDYVRLPSGDKLPLRGVQYVKGGGHTGAMTGAMVATGIVFFPAAPLFLFMKGKDITIPEGHEVTVYTNTEYTVKPTAASIAATSVAAPAKLTGAPLTNDDVIALKQAGLSEQLIIDKIRSSPAKFTLETSDLVALKKAGIPDAVVSAMIDAQKR